MSCSTVVFRVKQPERAGGSDATCWAVCQQVWIGRRCRGARFTNRPVLLPIHHARTRQAGQGGNQSGTFSRPAQPPPPPSPPFRQGRFFHGANTTGEHRGRSRALQLFNSIRELAAAVKCFFNRRFCLSAWLTAPPPPLLPVLAPSPCFLSFYFGHWPFWSVCMERTNHFVVYTFDINLIKTFLIIQDMPSVFCVNMCA